MANITSIAQTLVTIVLLITLAGIVAYAGSDILKSIETTALSSTSAINESFTVASAPSNQVVNNYELSGVTAIANQTCEVLVPGDGGNYTVNTANNSITFNLTSTNNDCPVSATGLKYNVTYSYNVINIEVQTARNASKGIGELARQFPNIGLVGGIAALLTILISAFAFSKIKGSEI